MNQNQNHKQSPELTSGTGFTFEDGVVAIYLASLLDESTAPGLPSRIVTKVATQQANYGQPLDDLIVYGCGQDGGNICLSLQVKRPLTISSAKSNSDFREVVLRSYQTIKKPYFQNNIDRVGVATGTISDQAKRRLETICEWARDCTSEDAFFQRLAAGSASQQHRDTVQAFRDILKDKLEPGTENAEVYQLLKHFVLLQFNLLHEGSIHEAQTVKLLRHCLHEENAERADDLWRRLRLIAREGAGRSAELNRQTLLNRLYGAFRFRGALSLQSSLLCLKEEARLAIADITSDIDGIFINRQTVLDEVKSSLNNHRFVQIIGLPGTGKSGVFRELVQEYFNAGSILILKADRLSGSNWLAYSQALGLSPVLLEVLLMEISITGSPILFIDGLDRIEISNQKIILDIVNTILRAPNLTTQWSIVATLRDSGIEPLRTWMPTELLRGEGVATVEVKPFNDDEAEILSNEKPELRDLLFGEERLREIARRPFFANVLARNFIQQGAVAKPLFRSEIDLIDAWWSRGGFNIDSNFLIRCQRTLVRLAQLGANTLGRRIRLHDVDLDAVARLRAEGILRDVRSGHSIKFAHDIFFEWAFFQFLIDCEEDWLNEIQVVGEPPVLGRTVELLSQDIFLDEDDWGSHLERLEISSLRPQWTRAWLLGPFSIPSFSDRENLFTLAVISNQSQRLLKLAVWFQAEKTRANPVVLEHSFANTQLSNREIMQLADTLAWPSDVATWSRCCKWLLDHIDEFSINILPDVLSVFEVWQNALADLKNQTSYRILRVVKIWLEEVENCCHSESFSYDYGRWDSLRRNGLEEFEKRLRSLLLRSARAATEDIEAYLTRVISIRRLSNSVFEQIIQYSSILSEVCASKLAELTLVELRGALPQEVANRPRDNRSTSPSFSFFHWRELAIEHPSQVFHPPSPLREPFNSLFQKAPGEALCIVRNLTNHAITAWRQLFNLDWENNLTPIPLVLDFPWGQQSFWGDAQVYLWFRGHQGPDAVEAGLMALEAWAFSEVESGRDVDDVIRDVVTGHESCSVLGIATTIALNSRRISANTLPLVASQRLWKWDIQRRVQDMSSPTNLMGFSVRSEPIHLEAVRTSNSRDIRKTDIRFLAQIFVLHQNEELREAAQSAIQAFPHSLPYEYEESQQDESETSGLLLTAEIWAELGKPNNYQFTPLEDGSAVQIELDNPRNTQPDMVEAAQQHEEYNHRLGILLWIYNGFEKNLLEETFTISDAIEIAKHLDEENLFIEPYNTLDFYNSLAILAGVAAVALKFSDELLEEDLLWAADIVLRTADTPEYQEEMWSPHSLVMHHPCLYAAYGLVSLIKRGLSTLEAKRRLIRLSGHPLEQISVATIVSSFELWSIDANFSWLMLDLGIMLSTEILFSEEESEEEESQRTVINPIDKALELLEKNEEIAVSLTEIPEPWVFAPPQPRRDFLNVEYRSEVPVWREPDVVLRWDFLPKILQKVPVSVIMSDPIRKSAFLEFSSSLIRWTIERLSPSCMDQSQKREFERRSANLLEWRSHLSQVLARVLLFTDIQEAKTIFLDPVFGLDTELAASLIAPFLSMLACHVMDSPEIPRNALSLMEICLPSILQYRDWDDARHRDGRLSGFDIPKIVSILLFIHVEEAIGASRFANGNWRDISEVMPIVDPFIRSVGDVASVTSRFLTLCERSIKHYPVEIFVEQVTCILSKDSNIPTGWHGSTIPLRIASLVQAFAEREHPLERQLAQDMLWILDLLVDMGVRRAAALQISELFKDVRVS